MRTQRCLQNKTHLNPDFAHKIGFPYNFRSPPFHLVHFPFPLFYKNGKKCPTDDDVLETTEWRNGETPIIINGGVEHSYAKLLH